MLITSNATGQLPGSESFRNDRSGPGVSQGHGHSIFDGFTGEKMMEINNKFNTNFLSVH